MFKAGQANPYDEIVTKTTDEHLTSENWELILNLCDKVQEEREVGARNVVAALIKRLAHRNPNVQLYALSLGEALSKNCGVELHRELASRAYTQCLERIITDRTTHEKVRRRALGLIAMWTAEFENDPTLGIMEECYNLLKSKNYKFETPQEPPPLTVDDEIRRKEEEELQRVLEMSMRDKGGRSQWDAYTSGSSGGAGVSGSSSSTVIRNASASGSGSSATASRSQASYSQPSYHSGYVPARTPSPKTQNSASLTTVSANSAAAAEPVASASSSSSTASATIVTRVRALHTFEPTEPGELPFEKGDVIKVVDRGYKDWWRGQLKGRTGIFPVNYVEPLPEPTAAELAREAEQEAAVFTQAANIDKLLTMLRSLDPVKDNLADNEEIQELYRSSMSLRPKIVKLIDKYSQKRADLVSMNDSFMRARTIFDRMMEESLARHTGVYETRSSFRAQPSQYPLHSDPQGRQDYANPQGYGWSPNAYEQPAQPNFPTPASYASPAPAGQDPASYQGSAQHYGEPNGHSQQQAPYPHTQPYSAQPTNASYGAQAAGPAPYAHGQQPLQQVPQIDTTPISHILQASQSHQPQQQPQPSQAPTQQIQTQGQVQPQTQQTSAQVLIGPPYVYDPNGTYDNPNVQAWAKYYAQGGKDMTGALYFVSIPGVKEVTPTQLTPGVQDNTPHVQAQQQASAGQSSSPTISPQGGSDSRQPGYSAAPSGEYTGYSASQQQYHDPAAAPYSAPGPSSQSTYAPSGPGVPQNRPAGSPSGSTHYPSAVYQPASSSPTSSVYAVQDQGSQQTLPQPRHSVSPGGYGNAPGTNGNENGAPWLSHYNSQSQLSGVGIPNVGEPSRTGQVPQALG